MINIDKNKTLPNNSWQNFGNIWSHVTHFDNFYQTFIEHIVVLCERFWTCWVWSCAIVRKFCRSRNMLQHGYWIYKIGFDRAENEPSNTWCLLTCSSADFGVRITYRGPHLQASFRMVGGMSASLSWQVNEFQSLECTKRQISYTVLLGIFSLIQPKTDPSKLLRWK